MCPFVDCCRKSDNRMNENGFWQVRLCCCIFYDTVARVLFNSYKYLPRTNEIVVMKSCVIFYNICIRSHLFCSADKVYSNRLSTVIFKTLYTCVSKNNFIDGISSFYGYLHSLLIFITHRDKVSKYHAIVIKSTLIIWV